MGAVAGDGDGLDVEGGAVGEGVLGEGFKGEGEGFGDDAGEVADAEADGDDAGGAVGFGGVEDGFEKAFGYSEFMHGGGCDPWWFVLIPGVFGPSSPLGVLPRQGDVVGWYRSLQEAKDKAGSRSRTPYGGVADSGVARSREDSTEKRGELVEAGDDGVGL